MKWNMSTYDIRLIFLLLLLHKTFNMQDSSRSKYLEMIEYLDVQLLINNPFFTFALKNCLAVV